MSNQSHEQKPWIQTFSHQVFSIRWYGHTQHMTHVSHILIFLCFTSTWNLVHLLPTLHLPLTYTLKIHYSFSAVTKSIMSDLFRLHNCVVHNAMIRKVKLTFDDEAVFACGEDVFLIWGDDETCDGQFVSSQQPDLFWFWSYELVMSRHIWASNRMKRTSGYTSVVTGGSRCTTHLFGYKSLQFALLFQLLWWKKVIDCLCTLKII